MKKQESPGFSRGETVKIILGVDPGKHGALAWVHSDGRLLDVLDMPEADGAALGRLLRLAFDDRPTPDVAWVERVNAYAGGGRTMGATSAFNFGANWGGLITTLGYMGVAVHHVQPGTWTATLGVGRRRTEAKRDKNRSRQKALELWPDKADWFRRVKDTDRAEAALVAEFGRRQP